MSKGSWPFLTTMYAQPNREDRHRIKMCWFRSLYASSSDAEFCDRYSVNCAVGSHHAAWHGVWRWAWSLVLTLR